MTSSPSPTLESSVCFALYSSLQTTLGLYRDLLAPWGLTYQQLLVLAVVWERGEVAPGVLADELCLDPSSVSGLLGRMERADLIRREHDAADRRAVRVLPTERSLDIRAELGHLERCVTEAMQITRADAETLVASLHSLRTTVRAYDGRAATADALASRPGASPPSEDPRDRSAHE